MTRLRLDQTRRMALAAQGLRRRPTGNVDVRHFRRVLADLDVVQLDTVNVLARSHYLPFFTRLGPYDRQRLDRWLWRSREAFEGWIHVASLSAMADWPLTRHRHDAATPRPGGRVSRLLAEHPGYLDAVLAEVAARGPTSVSDLDHAGERTGPWWGVPQGKTALDWLFYRGDLSIHDRTANFVTRYDLTDRVIPEAVRTAPRPDKAVAEEELLVRAARALGVATVTDLADYHRVNIVRARRAVARLVADDRLTEVEVAGWGQPAYVHPDAMVPRRPPDAAALLSPFDSLVWFRDRTERLFGFRYRIEIYVPEAQRTYGYYVLPFLVGDRLVARVDLKAERSTGTLLVRGSFAEDGVDRTAVARALASELRGLAAWLGLGAVAVAGNGDLAPALQGASP